MPLPLTELSEFNADPDRYAASHFGLPLALYIEWIKLDGTPLCAGQVGTGQDCRNGIGPSKMSPNAWYNSHREAYCKSHRG